MTTSYLSPSCSCVECHKKLSAKGIHSHYISSHTKEGNDRRITGGKTSIAIMRSADNLKNTFINIKETWKAYYANPKICKHCGNEHDWFRRHNKFCSKSCSAIYENVNRPPISDITRHKMSSSARLNNIRRGARLCRVSMCVVCKQYFSGSKKTCSNRCLQILRNENAKKNLLGKDGMRQGKMTFVNDSFGNRVRLESSYEMKLSIILDSLNVLWIRPSPIEYVMYGKNRRYYPDFYLPEYDIYLDPKNKYLITIDLEKISCVMHQNNVQIIILPIHNITNEFINQLCADVKNRT